MIPAQRRRDMLKMIAAQGVGTIAELSQLYGVSEMTIRRDLKALEQEGHLVYTHGGALAPLLLDAEPLYPARRYHLAEQKKLLARYAVNSFVNHNDIIILEGGTTIAAMTPFLAEKENLTVVTNGLHVTNELRALLPGSTIICTGGILREVSFTFVGPVAEGFFRQFYARKVFLSGLGFTLETGLTDPQMIDTQVKKAMIDSADQVIVLLDSSKFGQRSFTSVVRPTDIDVLITDSGAPPDVLDELRAVGVDLHIVEHIDS